MKRSNRPNKNISEITPSLNHRLSLYALAAGAAGVGLLALTQPALAEIIYTPAHSRLAHGTLGIDLENDGNAEFTLHDLLFKTEGRSYARSSRLLRLDGSAGASVVFEKAFAMAMASGSVVSSHRKFSNTGANKVTMAIAGELYCGSSCGKVFGYGPWQNVENRYLGLKFTGSDGETHYGWARLSVGSAMIPPVMVATLTGYAYETVANQSIKAGQTTETDSDASARDNDNENPGGSTLGELALGAVK